jgi:predicted chitinase
MTVDEACKMFPGAARTNVEANLPLVLQALNEAGLADPDMVLMALATIRAETGVFLPISEVPSRFNSSGQTGGHAFDLYDHRAALGNQGPPDGERFRGRGFVQLTGRANYRQHGEAIGLGDQLLENPDLANDPRIAARLLASFLKHREEHIRAKLAAGDFAAARTLVNGGSYGVKAFTEAFQTGQRLAGEAEPPPVNAA